MAGEREIEEETRNQMMQNLFGDQSEEEEEVEIDSDRDAAAHHASHYQSDEGEGDADIEGEGEVDMEGQGEVEDDSEPEDESGEEAESEAEMRQPDHEQGESETDRAQSSAERESSEQRAESEGKDDAESENQEYGHRVVTSQRREVVMSESERSEDNHHADNDDDEVDQQRKASSSSEEHDHAVVRDVFGDSEEDESAEYEAQNDIEHDLHRSPLEEEEENYHKDVRPEDMVPDEDAQYESEDDNVEQKQNEKEMGPPLDLEIPLHRPPGLPEKMNVIKVSNIMGIEPKPFDPSTYEEEDIFVTDESGTKKRIRLEDNIVRWRTVKNRDGTISHESNARFVRWSDGSLQLLIGNEVLDISVQEAQHDHAHLFLRHEKGILQSQGRLLHKMRFMPSSLSSKSHRLLTALVDSRHKKVYKVKNCITNIDPEKEEEKERKEGQSIRAMEQLHRKREKYQKRNYNNDNRGQQLSPGFLEEALNEDDDPEEYYSSRRAAVRRRFEEDMEMESQAEKRIMNAKRSHPLKDIPRKYVRATHPSKHLVEEYSDSDKEESEYESEGNDGRSPGGIVASDHEDEYNVENAEEEMEEAHAASRDDEEEEPKRRNKEHVRSSQKHKEIESDGESPPRKTMTHRRLAVFDSDED